MMINELKYFVYNASLPKPILTSQLLIKEKSGVIIRIKNTAGEYGFGECSPLPGFSKESIKDVLENIQRLQARISFEKNLSPEDTLKFTGTYASSKFGFEQAFHSLTKHKTVTIGSLPKKIKTNFLIENDGKEEVIKEIGIAVELGYDTIKLKIGLNPFSSDLDLIESINDGFPSLQLRLDVNGAWSENKAEKNIRKLEHFNIEYIEQPVKNLISILELSKNTELNLAPDESITGFDDAALALDNEGINYIVIKPMNIGFDSALQIVERANKLKKNVIISGMFESIVGFNGLLFLASSTNHNSSHGLSVLLRPDIFSDTAIPEKEQDKILFYESNYPPDYNFEKFFN